MLLKIIPHKKTYLGSSTHESYRQHCQILGWNAIGQSLCPPAVRISSSVRMVLEWGYWVGVAAALRGSTGCWLLAAGAGARGSTGCWLAAAGAGAKGGAAVAVRGTRAWWVFEAGVR